MSQAAELRMTRNLENYNFYKLKKVFSENSVLKFFQLQKFAMKIFAATKKPRKILTSLSWASSYKAVIKSKRL